MKKKAFTYFICWLPLWGISNVQLGIYLGYTPELNNLYRGNTLDGGDDPSGYQLRAQSWYAMEFHNNLIQQAGATGHAANTKTLSFPWGLTVGGEVRYQWNALLVRLAIDHTLQMGGRSGFLEAGGYANEIRYESWAFSIPVSFALSHALAEYYQFYFGLGPYYGISYVKVSHSAPQAFAHIGPTSLPASELPFQAAELYAPMLGIHYILGLQFPIIINKIYLSFDFISYNAQSAPELVRGSDSLGAPITNFYSQLTQRGERIIIAVQYYIGI